MKSLAFASGCRLLHLHLIENYETILLLPRFATSPTDLHVAVSQALLSLMTSVRSFDRPYLSYLSALLLDLFVFLRGQVALPMAAFTQRVCWNQSYLLWFSSDKKRRVVGYDASCISLSFLSSRIHSCFL